MSNSVTMCGKVTISHLTLASSQDVFSSLDLFQEPEHHTEAELLPATKLLVNSVGGVNSKLWFRKIKERKIYSIRIGNLINCKVTL